MVDDPAPRPVRVNFQTPTAVTPADHLPDAGAGFATRTTLDGEQVRYGWRDQRTGAPIDLDVGGTTPGNGRVRGLAADARLDSLMHLQSIDLQRRGVSFDGFIPSGAAGTGGRHTTATAVVAVTDGALTIDAVGGTNTKLHYVEVAPTDAAAQDLPGARRVAFVTEPLTGQGNVVALPGAVQADVATARLVDGSPGTIEPAGDAQIRLTFADPLTVATWLVVHYRTVANGPRELRVLLTVDDEPDEQSDEQHDDASDDTDDDTDDDTATDHDGEG